MGNPDKRIEQVKEAWTPEYWPASWGITYISHSRLSLKTLDILLEWPSSFINENWKRRQQKNIHSFSGLLLLPGELLLLLLLFLPLQPSSSSSSSFIFIATPNYILPVTFEKWGKCVRCWLLFFSLFIIFPGYSIVKYIKSENDGAAAVNWQIWGSTALQFSSKFFFFKVAVVETLKLWLSLSIWQVPWLYSICVPAQFVKQHFFLSCFIDIA